MVMGVNGILQDYKSQVCSMMRHYCFLFANLCVNLCDIMYIVMTAVNTE